MLESVTFEVYILVFFLSASVLWLRMNWITPTSQALGLAAQNRLLKHFVKTPFEVKVSNNSLNYIDIRVNKPKYRQERVLVLMHGYASGLGYFFGNFLFLHTATTIISLIQTIMMR